MSDLPPKVVQLYNHHSKLVESLCEQLGYGFVMSEASRLWMNKDPIGAFVVGPCATFTESCPCSSCCDKCYGAGWTFPNPEEREGI